MPMCMQLVVFNVTLWIELLLPILSVRGKPFIFFTNDFILIDKSFSITESLYTHIHSHTYTVNSLTGYLDYNLDTPSKLKKRKQHKIFMCKFFHQPWPCYI